MFGRCLSSQSGKIDSAWADAYRPRSKTPSSPILSDIGRANSRISIGVMPVPIQIPNRSGTSFEVSSPESSTARAAAPTANFTARLITFSLFR